MKRILFSLFGLLPFVLGAQADYDKYPKASDKYLIKNVFVYQNDMSTRTQDILIDDGKIVKIGSIDKSKGAQVIDADSMYVYPSFIDVMSYIDGKEDKKKERPEVRFPGKPTDEQAGITPDKDVYAMLSKDKPNFEKYRKAGFTIAQFGSSKGMLPSNTSIIALADDADNFRFNQEQNLVGQLKPAAGRIYPSTIIGVMAKFRDLYHNAEIYTTNKAAYDKSPTSDLPTSSPAIAALVPLTKKQSAMYWRASGKLTAMRAVQLQKELGFDMTLTGIKALGALEDDIIASRLPMALSIELPKEVKKIEKDSADITDEERALHKRSKDAYTVALAFAKRLEEKNIAFAFSTESNTPKDVKKYLETSIENGLSEKVAIDALTINAAKMLKIDNQVGSVQKGKLAHIIITTKPYFEKSSHIQYVVAGKEIHEYEKTEAKNAPSAGLDIVGTWSYTIETPYGNREGEIIIEKDGDEYVTKISSSESPSDFADGNNLSVDGESLSFAFDTDVMGTSMTINISVEIKENTSMDGTASIAQFGAFPLTGKKTSSPE